jgi:putative ABC transport system permease protein
VDPRPRRPNRLTSVRADRARLTPVQARTSTLVAGIAATAAAFTILCMNASALTVQVRGQLPAASPPRAYDILVRVPSRVAHQAGADSLARPNDLAELSGGITLAQYDTIRALPGVQVAAPMTMVGYVPLTVIIPVAVPASALTSTPALFTVTARQRSDAGLSSVTEQNVGSTYVTTSPLALSTVDAGPEGGEVEAAPDGGLTLVCPSASPTPLPQVFSVDAQRRTTCWSTSTGADPADWSGRPPATISVPFAWTFLLPLVAVDPAAEAALLRLNRAVTQGSYLPTNGVTSSGPVPVIMASSIDDDAQDSLTLSRLPISAAIHYASGLTADQINALLDATNGQPIGGTDTVTAAQAYRELLSFLPGSHAATVSAYWTPGPAHYAVGADGELIPQPVPADPAVWAAPYALTGEDAATIDTADVGFRALTPHVAVTFTSSAAAAGRPFSGAALHVVGVFDPAQVASSAATPSPYLGEQLSGGDAASRRLLGSGTLAPDGNPAGYPSPGATLVMPLQDIGAFTAAGRYTHTDARAPIGSIRVRVAGVTGDDALSQARVRMVAQEIVRATGLNVDVTLAASAATRTIDLAAGRDGRPALQLSEIWYRSDTRTTVSSAVDPRSVGLSTGVLLIGSVFVVSGSSAALRRRRRELSTLRALGWRRRRLAWQLVRVFALISATAGMLAVLIAYAVEAALSRDAATGWPLLSLPAAVVMTVVAAWWQARRISAEPVSATELAGTAAGLRARPPGVIRHAVRTMFRVVRRNASGALVITVACAALGLELAVRWVFGGVVVGSWLGAPFSWQDDPVDLAAVLTVVALATVTMTDISWLSAERAVELRTLRAIGWSARGVARLAVSEAALLGVAGGLAGSVLDVAGILAVVHRLPAGLLPVIAVVVGTGVAMAMVAFGIPAVARGFRPSSWPTSDDHAMTTR